MLIFNEASYDKFECRLRPGGSLFLNTSLVRIPARRHDIRRIEVRANGIAEELGDIRIANMVMLGALICTSGMVTLEAVLAALKQVLPERRHALLPLNEQALKLGAEACLAH